MTECKAEPDSICLLRAGRNGVFGCHSRLAGMYCINHWIPAFAGMTAGVISIFGQPYQGALELGLPGLTVTHQGVSRCTLTGRLDCRSLRLVSVS